MARQEPDGRRPWYPGLGELLDIFQLRQYFDAITEVRETARRVAADARFLGGLRRAALKLPFERYTPAANPLPPARLSAVRGLAGQRVALVASGGSGALASLIGVFRAFEDAGVRPASMSFASGAALYAFPLAAGLSPDEVASFVLERDPAEWCDFDWGRIAGLLPARGRGFGGLMKGERVEASYRSLLGDRRLGELEIPAYAPVWSVEENRLEYLGPATHPELEVACAIRMAISLPLLFDPVRWQGESWCDGGLVDILPVHPVLYLEPVPDAALVVNCFYPRGFRGEDQTGWRGREWSILDIASQVKTAQHVQLARENLERLRSCVGALEAIEPVAYREVRASGFYAEFLEREDWPRFMRAGQAAALPALRRLGRRLGRRLPTAAVS